MRLIMPKWKFLTFLWTCLCTFFIKSPQKALSKCYFIGDGICPLCMYSSWLLRSRTWVGLTWINQGSFFIPIIPQILKHIWLHFRQIILSWIDDKLQESDYNFWLSLLKMIVDWKVPKFTASSFWDQLI